VQIFRRIVNESDVVIENFRPGVADRLGIGYDELSKDNPGLVYCEITGMGASGPLRDRPTFDAIAQAMSGLWSTFTDMDKPEAIGPPMADQLTGIYGACAVLGGLVSRQKTGVGTKLSLNMVSAAMSFIGPSISSFVEDSRKGDVREQKKTDRAHGSQSYAFLDSEGRPFSIHLSSPPKFWEGLCAAVGHPELASDSRYDAHGKRIQRYDELHATFAAFFTARSREFWIEELTERDVPCAPIYSLGESLQDPQIRYLDMLWTDPAAGYSLVRSPIQHAGQFAAADGAAPWLGQHTVEVLSSLGLAEHEIEALRDDGAL
jgi:crotonobetainyl-CoA:carnitine CoA-transferase CaiB-like acyl-CoA transferase